MSEKQTQPASMGHNAVPIDVMLGEQYAELIDRVQPLAERATAATKDKKKIETEADLEKISPIVVAAKALTKELETARTAEKDPYLNGGKAVDAFFADHKARLGRIVTVFEGMASDFQREKIAEARRVAEAEARKREAEAAALREKAEKAAKSETKQRHLDRAAEADNAADRAEAEAKRSAADFSKVQTSGGTSRASTFWDFRIDDYPGLDLNAIRDFIDRPAIEKAIKAKIKIQGGDTVIGGVAVFQNVKSSIR